jgi:pilus assembly protein FimV
MDEKMREMRLDITRILFRLIIAIFCFAPIHAFALGVGQVKVNSALNQPLNAEIPLLSAKAEDLAELTVRISSQTFEGLGVTDAEFGYSIESRNSRNYIKITSKQPIREPLLNFLIEVEWPKGRLLREFAVLLNPPSFVNATEPEPAPPAIPPTPRKPPSQRTRPPSSSPAPAAGPRAPAAEEPPPPPGADTAGAGSAPTQFSGTNGPVRRGETLWRISERVRPDP